MNRQETVKKYQAFLNKGIALALVGKFNTMSALVAKHGVSSNLSGFLTQKKIFEYDVNQKGYRTSRVTDFTEPEVQMLIADYNAFKYKRVKPPLTTTASSGLSGYSTKELLAELKSRGYAGKIFIKKEINF